MTEALIRITVTYWWKHVGKSPLIDFCIDERDVYRMVPPASGDTDNTDTVEWRWTYFVIF